MKNIIWILSLAVFALTAETLFEVKDASNNKVLDISTDGLRVMNLGDTLMVISSTGIQANLRNSRGLSRSFSVATSTSKGSSADIMRLTADSTRFWISDTGSGFGVAKGSGLKGVNPNLLEVSTSETKMREGTAGEKYTDFSPENIFIGLNAGSATNPDSANGTGIDNVFLGNRSGISNHFGISNVFIGKDAGYSNIGDGTFLNGEKNVFIGLSSGYSNQSGACNVFIGKDSGKANTTGLHNICVGTQAGFSNETGGENVFIGGLSAFNCSGTGNVFLGYLSGMHATGDGNVLIGHHAGENLSGSNKLYIENTDSDQPLIYGDFTRDSVKINGKFAVTGKTYLTNLDVSSGSVMDGTLSVGSLLSVAGATTLSSTLQTSGNATFNGSKVSLMHPNGTTQGLFFQNTYSGNTDSWHLYQSVSDAFQLYYNTSLRGSWDITTGIYTATPGVKIKNIEEAKNLTDKVMKLQPKRYDFVEEGNENRKYIGLIAQDVKEIFPEFVYYHKENDIYSIDYAGMSVVAIQAIKEQQNEIDELRNTNEMLIKRIEEIEKKLNK